MVTKIWIYEKSCNGSCALCFYDISSSFLNVSLSSCNASGNVVLNGKDLIIEKMKRLQLPTRISLKSDTNKVEDVKVDTTGNNELIGDFRYDNLYK